jgi:hypothetical protein
MDCRPPPGNSETIFTVLAPGLGWIDGNTTTVVDHRTGERPRYESKRLKDTVDHTSILKAYQFLGF